MKKSNIFKRIIIAAGVLASVAFYIFESESDRAGNMQSSAGLVFENGDKVGDDFVFNGSDSLHGNVAEVSDGRYAGKISELTEEELKSLIELSVEEALNKALEEKMDEAAKGAFGDALRDAVRDEIIKAGEEGYLEDSLNRSEELAEKKSGLVNINTADKNELMSLQGIGEKKASDIISYREQNGGFKSTDELMNISGIKEAMYEKIKEKITV